MVVIAISIVLFKPLTRIFHTDRDEEAAKLGWGKADEHFDAGLYVSILTRSHLLGSPLRAAPNLTVTAVYPRLSRALVLSKSQCEFERSIHPSFPVSAIDQYEISGLRKKITLMVCPS